MSESTAAAPAAAKASFWEDLIDIYLQPAAAGLLMKFGFMTLPPL